MRDGPVAGAGVAVRYVSLGLAAPSAALWPVAASRPYSCCCRPLCGTGRRVRSPVSPPVAPRRGGAVLGLILHLLAAQRWLLAVAVVLASLRPALPVVLGPALLPERVSARQTAGRRGGHGAADARPRCQLQVAE
ncbi:hypothetical protein [Streptomyces spinosirectus]